MRQVSRRDFAASAAYFARPRQLSVSVGHIRQPLMSHSDLADEPLLSRFLAGLMLHFIAITSCR